MNALLGPNRERTYYRRLGSCCPFKTPNGIIENRGLLDTYGLWWKSCPDTLTIYINMYDEGDLFIPTGLHARN